MSTNVELPCSRARAESKPRSSWARGVLLFLALSSVSLLNLCHASAASGSHTVHALGASPILACDCLAEANVPAEPVSSAAEDVFRIDEDWELVVTEPDPNLAAPQIQTVMSPFTNLDGFYICFLVNHRNNPQLAMGGLEVQFWYGDYQLGARRMDLEVLQSSNEHITWTQRLMIKGNPGSRYLCFRVVDGQSDSWGSFGGTEPLHMNIDTSQSNLAGYSSGFSVANSGVFFASNRVERLVLLAVRGYSEAGDLLFEQSTPVVVYDGQAH